MSSKEKMNRAYIDSKISGIFEPMVAAILQDNPTDVVNNIVSYFSRSITWSSISRTTTATDHQVSIQLNLTKSL